MTTPHDHRPDTDRESDASGDEEHPTTSEGSPENLPPQAWVSLILFALFIVFTSGCMIIFR